jgi:HlyD family secretion protein
MKMFFAVHFGLIIVSAFIGTAVFLYQKSQQKPVIYKTVKPFTSDIIKKTVATGKIIPRREVEIKSQVSGVVEKIFIDAGQLVKKGDLIARIQIIPNMERLNAAESRLDVAKLNHTNSKKELDRQYQLFKDKLIPEFEYNKYVHDYNLQVESLSSAESNLAIIREGASLKEGKISNLVTATLDGLILNIPVKEGTFVTETNTFNAGTTIANIANMTDMIFEGTVDESEVGKIHVGMNLLLNIGAMESEPFHATLEYISPKGIDDQGTIKFEIRATVTLRDNHFLRAGYSANADIVLNRAEQVIALNERLLTFEGDKIFVDVETGPQVFEKREIQTGLSDGINIEVKSGIRMGESIKQP